MRAPKEPMTWVRSSTYSVRMVFFVPCGILGAEEASITHTYIVDKE